jgi:poly(A)-specific ribonuclease
MVVSGLRLVTQKNERMKVNKISAVEFLIRNGFRMDAPFLDGVSYLSRHEEAEAKQQALKRHDRSRSIADIDIKEEDLESIEFLEQARGQIKEWLAQQGPVGAPDNQLSSRTNLS